MNNVRSQSIRKKPNRISPNNKDNLQKIIPSYLIYCNDWSGVHKSVVKLLDLDSAVYR